MERRRIIVDWGTSNFRAWLVDAADGAVLDEIAAGRGMTGLARAEFPPYCAERLAGWRTGTHLPPVYLAGMVGAAQGWREAPQLPLPVGLEDLAGRLVPAPGLAEAWILPGVRLAGDRPDVMRGEEVQIFGALDLAGRADAVLCLPGTHSKWARVEGGRLVGFTTSMTGEMHALLLGHSILGRGAEEGGDPVGAAFDLGLAQSAEAGGLAHHLFTARGRALHGGLAPADVAPYLSGVLIGAEVAAMAGPYPPGAQELLLVGAAALRAPYERALRRAGYRVGWIDGGAASRRGIGAIVDRQTAAARIRLIVVMGVAGSGKSTVGSALAERLDSRFLDADDYHPAANVEKMAHGIPLDDADRWPWLDRLGGALHAAAGKGGIAVSACSALRRAYRERLVAAAGEPVLFVHLSGAREVIARRMTERTGHFMPPALLDSQFATLEPLAADERAITIEIGPPAAELVESIRRQLAGMQVIEEVK